MNFQELRIGYVPVSNNFKQPTDRRRFCHYASKRNISFEIAKPSESYDVVIVTQVGDLSLWRDYNKGKVIFDFIDSYLAIPKNNPKGLLRGLGKYAVGQSRYLQLNYWKALESMCQRADAVICITEEQKQDISKFCQNVHIIFDIHTNVVRHVKTDYSSSKVFNFVWEGLPENLHLFSEIQGVLKYLKSKYQIALHIVTDLEFYQFFRKYRKRHTTDIAHKLFDNLFDNVYLYGWNEQLCSNIITACDMALIPIDLNNPLASGKPETKLMLFWRMGVPAVVSATPVYTRTMQRCGLSMACRTQQEWQETLERYIIDMSARQDAGQRGKTFAENYYSEEKILAQWDSLIASVL
ncbi:hypothetical protein PN36_08980 [Candidatus Thiomargarita nelsonii]|uniref:Glycosyltransferase family 1 protein n=1 Tax=Candidatus Thiomargarita nelsonii TaxID=1003181 RepID=A0A0A6P4R8_9GAMM|nr:hypothetical protein PN36_08980 [Candidatus Thiomargarita nelsonii]